LDEKIGVLEHPDGSRRRMIAAHELTECYFVILAARGLRLPLRFGEFKPFFDRFFKFVATEDLKGDKPNISLGLLADFPHFIVELGQRFTGEEGREERLNLRIPEAIVPIFREIIQLQTSMLEEPTILTYLEAVRTLSRDDWQSYMGATLGPRDVALAADTPGMSSAAIFNGFLTMASVMSRINGTVVRTETDEEQADSATMLEYVRAAIDWRLDFKTRESMRRFDQVKSQIIENAASEIPYARRGQFRDEFDRLFNDAFQLALA
jgi:hypothetical protein